MAQERTENVMSIVANGQTRKVPVDCTLSGLLEELHIVSRYVVVQLDGEIVPRERYGQTVLRQNCKLEIITLVGGG